MSSSLEAPPSSRGGATAAPGTLDERLNSLLSSSQFSVASYLNLAFKGDAAAATHIQSDQDNDALQRRMAELALQLQLQTQACHEDIGRIGAELQAILPRCAADVGRVGVGLDGMKADAASLLEATQSTTQNDEVSSSLETLSTLHALRSNLSRTREILQAAATWDSTLSSIPPLLASQNLAEAVTALAQLESGERALRGMPSGKKERQEALHKVRSQIQVLLQPQLKHALHNMNTRLAPLQQCVDLYRALGTMDTLQEEYVKNRPGAIHKAWFAFSPSINDSMGIDETEESSPAAPPSFVTFLPSWYDAVLSLLAEERRQSLAVFGPNLAPEMIAKVLFECFRPILPSFQSRLESLYSNDMQKTGSLQFICDVYKATLEFLSLAYESVAGAYLDVAETTTVTAVSLYQDITTVFLQVASPFGTYQEQLASLEEKHSTVARQLVAKDIQQAARSATLSSSSVSSLQDATERLQDLSSFIFPLAEGAIGRAELLQGGYKTEQALTTVDALVSSHAGELAIAVNTLSATMTGDGKDLADDFDEQHVLCALQVLKVAGAFKRELGAFEEKSRKRLALLTERMAAYMAQEKELADAVGSSAASYLLPDSLSVVEIDSLLTKAVCSEGLDDTDASFSVLQRLASMENPVDLYPKAKESTVRLAGSCHSFVFDVCSAVPRKHLGSMTNMTSWTESSGTEIDSYGTLPQPYITQVGEHMLALVQALEPFASDPEALSLANDVMDGIEAIPAGPWHEFITAAGATEQENVLRILMDGKGLSDFVIADAPLEEEELEDEEVDESAKASAAFCNAWLDVVGLAVTGRLFERIMRIQRLTPKGSEHLEVDLNYLINVLSALGVSGHPHPLVNHFAELVIMDDVAMREQIMNRDRSHPVMAVLRAVEVRIALMRGISAN